MASRRTRSPNAGPRAGPARPAATIVRGARAHNLRDIDCQIPLGKITAITGVSGSGKSTLAFDVLYAEGQRRFVECLSAYARQFLERLDRPEAESIGYIQPPVAIKQRVSIRNARSTVGSITELTDLLRLLFVHAGRVHCAHCGGRVLSTGSEEAVSAVRDLPEETRIGIVAPLQGPLDAAALAELDRQGYRRLWVDGRVVEIDDPSAVLSKAKRSPPRRRRGSRAPASSGVVVDRIVAGRARRNRIVEAVQAAWRMAEGRCLLVDLRTDPASAPAPIALRQGSSCSQCGRPAAPPTLGLFSWNSPIGACPTCQGFGRVITLDRAKVVPNPRRNLRNDAVAPFSVPSGRNWYRRLLKAARSAGVPTDVPFRDLTPDQQAWVFEGDETFPGVEGYFRRLESKRYKMHVRIFIARFRGYVPCPDCGGSRLRPEALQVTVLGKTIHELHEMPITELVQAIDGFDPREAQRTGVGSLIESMQARLDYLAQVGVGYLTLGRSGRTLSGGETQRIRLAAALGSALTDTLYVLDEPTVGLHAIDTARVLCVLRRLTDGGNTVVVVEHDPDLIAGADHLIVLGPGGGARGGRVTYEGPVQDFLGANPTYFTAYGSAPPPAHRAHAGRGKAALPRGVTGRSRRAGRLKNPWDARAVGRWLDQHTVTRTAASAEGAQFAQGPRLTLTGAAQHNLRIDRLRLPLNRLVAVTGVSGSGKSTLLDAVIHRNWLRRAGKPVEDVGAVGSVTGFDGLEDVHLVGQELLGRSSRSNPISFVDAYGEIRKLLAGTLAARQRRLQAGAFSFNTAGGRCEACKGMGSQVLEMYFLPDVEVTCEACEGHRFRPEVLEVTWREKNIHDILQLSVDEAGAFFGSEPQIVARLSPLREVGLGYLRLGQSTTTLSGGEAQRLRLAGFLAKGDGDGRHLFLFDEPTTGLHAQDIERLLRALRGLLARGHGVIVVEHNLDLIAAADWVIDLGPGPGEEGGRVVCEGPLTALLTHESSVTAQALRARLGSG